MNKKYIKETLKYILRSNLFIQKYVDKIDTLYGMTQDELNLRNEKYFLILFRKAYDNSPFYHKLYSEAGISKEDIQCLDDIKKLPVITKEMVKAHAEEIRIAPKWKLIKNHTSGTTGTPLMVYEDWPSIWREQAYFYCYRKRCGYTYGQPMVSLRGNLEKKDLYLKVHISNTLYLSSYNINPQTTEIYYQQIVNHKPVAIEGYPSSLYSLALMLRDKGLQLHIPVAFTSSESLLDYQRELIEKQFDTQIYDHYGTTERTIRLSESFNHNGYLEDPGYSINEYTEDGEITTSLINFSFPLIRYKGNDIIELKKEEGRICVSKIHGRNEDYLICKDGSRIMRVGFIMKKAKNVKATQLIQQEYGKVLVKVVPENGFCEKDARLIMDALYDRVGQGNMEVCIDITTLEGLEYTTRGKFKYIVNKIS